MINNRKCKYSKIQHWVENRWICLVEHDCAINIQMNQLLNGVPCTQTENGTTYHL